MKDGTMDEESKFLDEVQSTYRVIGSKQNEVIRELVIRAFDPFIRKNDNPIGLVLGYTDGLEIELLSNRLETIHILEGSSKAIKLAQEIMPDIAIFHTLFENYTPPDDIRYDYVFANYVLEHVQDMHIVFEMIKNVLKPDGILFVTVPNARAFSRQLAVKMKLIEGLFALTENDVAHGHRRVFDRTFLNETLEQNGFRVVSEGGLMFKILADFQMDILYEQSVLTDDHVEGLYKMGLEYPDFAGSLYSVCRKAM